MLIDGNMVVHLDLAALVILLATLNAGASIDEKTSPKSVPLANELTYIESKDVLLQMLEKKLREIKDHKKKKADRNSDFLPKNVDFKLNCNGISAVGDSELILRYGKTGQGAVNLTSDGISNVGKAQLSVGVGENGINIPGINNLFSGLALASDNGNLQNQVQSVNAVNLGFRRISNPNDTDTAEILDKAAVRFAEVKKDKKEETSATNDKNASVRPVSVTNGTASAVTGGQ